MTRDEMREDRRQKGRDHGRDPAHDRRRHARDMAHRFQRQRVQVADQEPDGKELRQHEGNEQRKSRQRQIEPEAQQADGHHGDLHRQGHGHHAAHAEAHDDPRVSREHAVLIQRDEQLYLRDNGSSAGTFLNWKRLNPGEELLLRHNDLISFGEVAYELQLQSAEPSSSD